MRHFALAPPWFFFLIIAFVAIFTMGFPDSAGADNGNEMAIIPITLSSEIGSSPPLLTTASIAAITTETTAAKMVETKSLEVLEVTLVPSIVAASMTKIEVNQAITMEDTTRTNTLDAMNGLAPPQYSTENMVSELKCDFRSDQFG